MATREPSRPPSSSTPLHADLRHPTPDVQLPRRGPSRSIQKLEQSAAAMSEGGSDIAEEIRKMNDADKERRSSRQSSLQSTRSGDVGGVGPAGLPARVGSNRSSRADSHGDNIVHVNGAARWGGYSPEGHVTSPVGSVSGRSHASHHRTASGLKSSKLAQMPGPIQERRHLDSQLTAGAIPTSPEPRGGGEKDGERKEEQGRERTASQSSFARRYDEIAGEIERSMGYIPPTPTSHPAAPQAPLGTGTPPERPRSTDTFREAQLAFMDFDGVHFSPDTDEFVELDKNGREIRRVSARTSSGHLSVDAASLLRAPHARPTSYAAPPPAEGMVYYPAPVPSMLNLPKRLSKLPAANAQAKRRTQLLNQMSPGARQSAPWLLQGDTHETASGGKSTSPNERMSVANFANLPPHLRASAYFDHQPVQHDVEIKSESAVATLDSILAASATAPVSAFTDHPYAGDVSKAVYAPEHRPPKTARASIAPRFPAETKVKKKRSSSIGGLLRRMSSGDEIGNTLKTGNRPSLLMSDGDANEGGNDMRKRRSQLSLGDELESQAGKIRSPGTEISEPDLTMGLVGAAQNARSPEDEEPSKPRPQIAMGHARQISEGDQINQDFREQEEVEDLEEESEPVFAQPTTLLAELQVRKAQQKSRSRTAATSFPNGMHSTLLQLDAVEEIARQRRKTARVALAWEDPTLRVLEAEKEDDDDEVPLGMLFPNKDGVITKRMGDSRDWDRPLGLMEKRALEDNEPLSNRRHRLRGGSPVRGPSPSRRPLTGLGFVGSTSDVNVARHLEGSEAADGEEEDDEGETLAQRLRRMKTKDALDSAISDVTPGGRDSSSGKFADDVLSQFGGLDAKDKEAATAATAGPGASSKQNAFLEVPEDETLGQRRARLQREREAAGDNPGGVARPPLRSSNSLANLLSTNPIGQRPTNKNYQPADGTLLHASAQQQAKQRSQLMSANMRSSSFGFGQPLVDARPSNLHETSAGGLLGQQGTSRAPNGGFAGGAYNNGAGGVQIGASTPTTFGPAGQNGYFGSPSPMPYGASFGPSHSTMGFPQSPPQPQRGMMSPMTYQPTTGHSFANPPDMMNGAGYGYGMPQMMGGGWQQMASVPNMAYGGGGAAMGTDMGVMGMGTAAEGQLNTKQRAAIDRWRMSVAP